MNTYTIPAKDRGAAIERLSLILYSLPEKAHRLTITEARPTRSLSQNALLWALYCQIIDRGGEAMQGWEKEELHEFFLMNHFGHEVREIFGRKKMRPLRRSSGLNKQEFVDFTESIVRFMATRGVVLDMPE